MKFSAATLFAAGAAAATMGKRSVAYEVTDFSASCTQHSVQCNYQFGVLSPGTMQTEPQHCAITVTGLPDGKLPAVGPWEGKCEQTSKTFSVARDGENLILTVSAPVSPSSNTTGTYTIQAADLKTEQSGASIRQSYVGPKAFALEFSS